MVVLFATSNEEMHHELEQVWKAHADEDEDLAGWVFELADRFLSGIGVERNVERAKMLFNMAASRSWGSLIHTQDFALHWPLLKSEITCILTSLLPS